MSGPLALPVHSAALDAVPPRALYEILALRIQVFAIEQGMGAYQDLDGRDSEPGALLLWQEAGGVVVSTLRLLDDGKHRAIGRVATAEDHRGRGLATQLIHEAIALAGARPLELGSQSYLERWYARFGFERDGDDYVVNGIEHVHMRRPPS